MILAIVSGAWMIKGLPCCSSLHKRAEFSCHTASANILRQNATKEHSIKQICIWNRLLWSRSGRMCTSVDCSLAANSVSLWNDWQNVPAISSHTCYISCDNKLVWVFSLSCWIFISRNGRSNLSPGPEMRRSWIRIPRKEIRCCWSQSAKAWWATWFLISDKPVCDRRLALFLLMLP
jgi:hypothetical protein